MQFHGRRGPKVNARLTEQTNSPLSTRWPERTGTGVERVMKAVRSRQVIVMMRMMLTKVRKRMRRAQKPTEASLPSGLRLRWIGNFIVTTVVWCMKEVSGCLVDEGKG